MTNLELFNQLMSTLPVKYIACGLISFMAGWMIFITHNGCGIRDAIDCNNLWCGVAAVVHWLFWIAGILMIAAGVFLLVMT